MGARSFRGQPRLSVVTSRGWGALYLWPALILIALAVSCGGSGSGGTTPPPPPASTVTISPKTLTILTGATYQFSATISGATSQLVAWKVNGNWGGDSVHGVVSQDGVYVAPTSVPSPSTVTVTAVSFADISKSDSATVTIQANAGAHVVIAGGPGPVTVPTFGSRAFAANVTGSANTAVTWQVNGITGGSASTGTVNSNGVFYAPHSVPVSLNPNNDGRTTDVIVTAVSQADATASDSVIVTPFPAQQARFALPIPVGTTGGNGQDTTGSGANTYCCGGTLGSLVSRGGALYILSNTHVLARSDKASIGEPIIQPALVNTNCSLSATSTVANLSQFFNLENGSSPHVDAAIAEIIAGSVDPLGTIVQLGGTTSGGQPTDGTPNPGPGVPPTIGRAIAKSGGATGLTCATIIAIDTSVQIQYNKGCNSTSTFNTTYLNQVYITGAGFSADGDSGSLIVTQDTADPVALLYGGSDTDTVANPIADVLLQLADPSSGEQPVFVGDSSVGPHAVAACSLPQQTLSASTFLTTAESEILASRLPAATAARDAHASELLALPGVRALGTGPSFDRPGEAAVLLFVDRGAPRSGIPAEVDGIRTRVIEGESFARAGVLTPEASAALEQTLLTPPFVSSVADAEVARVRTVHEGRSAEFMARPDVQGVGITSSADAPGEGALLIILVRGMAHDPIPAAVDGVRTRVRETSRIHQR